MWEADEVYTFIDDVLKAGFPTRSTNLPDAERERIKAAYLKRQRKLAKMTVTPEDLKRRAEMEREFERGMPMRVPTPVHLD